MLFLVSYALKQIKIFLIYFGVIVVKIIFFKNVLFIFCSILNIYTTFNLFEGCLLIILFWLACFFNCKRTIVYYNIICNKILINVKWRENNRLSKEIDKIWVHIVLNLMSQYSFMVWTLEFIIYILRVYFINLCFRFL